MPPRLAIISPNTLEANGLKILLQDIIPMADVTDFPSVEDFMEENQITPFFHYFVSAQLLIDNIDFFMSHKKQTFVLTARNNNDAVLHNFYTINTNLDQHSLIKSLLQLHQKGHASHHYAMHNQNQTRELPISSREAEVLALVARGFINKEIAEKLCISLPTVVTHRKNICEKLNLRSVSALTIFAVMNGIVAVDDI